MTILVKEASPVKEKSVSILLLVPNYVVPGDMDVFFAPKKSMLLCLLTSPEANKPAWRVKGKLTVPAEPC